MAIFSGHEHHESPAVANVVVGRAESCLLRGIYRESIGRLRRPRTKGAATNGGAFIFTTTRPRNSRRPPPCPAPSFPWLSVLARGSAAFPPSSPPLWSCRIPNAPVSTLDLSIRRGKLTVHVQWIYSREIRFYGASREKDQEHDLDSMQIH